MLAQGMLPSTSWSNYPKTSEASTQTELPRDSAALQVLSWRELLVPLAETGAGRNFVLACRRCVLGWGFVLPSKRDAGGGQQSAWHQRWQKGNLIFSRTQEWAWNPNCTEGRADWVSACSVMAKAGNLWLLIKGRIPLLCLQICIYRICSVFW